MKGEKERRRLLGKLCRFNFRRTEMMIIGRAEMAKEVEREMMLKTTMKALVKRMNKGPVIGARRGMLGGIRNIKRSSIRRRCSALIMRNGAILLVNADKARTHKRRVMRCNLHTEALILMRYC